LLGQFLLYGLTTAACLAVAGIVGTVMAGAIIASFTGDGADVVSGVGRLMRQNLLTAILAILGYLATLASIAAMAELFLGLGFWKLVANNTTIHRIDSLAGVRTGNEDKALAGEGLADALNVGAY
jgi:hypothetical protein